MTNSAPTNLLLDNEVIPTVRSPIKDMIRLQTEFDLDNPTDSDQLHASKLMNPSNFGLNVTERATGDIDDYKRNILEGYLDVSCYPFYADKTGLEDSTEVINTAVRVAQLFNLITFFPRGEYLVSDTIDCEQLRYHRASGSTSNNFNSCVLRGENGSKIVLKENRFNDPNDPRPVIKFTRKVPGAAGGLYGNSRGDNMWQSLIDMEIEVRPGNLGAVGLFHEAAQNSIVHNVKIIGPDYAYAGFLGGTHAGGSVTDLDIQGFRCGIENSGGASCVYTRVSIINPSECGIRLRETSYGSIIFTGLDIKLDKPVPAIYANEMIRFAYGLLNIVDSRIEYQGDSAEVAIEANTSAYLKNVYIYRAANALAKYEKDKNKVVIGPKVENGVGVTYGCYVGCINPNGWNRVNEYAVAKRYNDSTSDWGWRYNYLPCAVLDGVISPSPSGLSENMLENRLVQVLDGQVTSQAIIGHNDETDIPPSDLCTRHSFKTPAFHDPEYINIKDLGVVGDGVTDDTLNLQQAIATGKNLYFPKGIYLVSEGLELMDGQKVTGLASSLSILRPHPSAMSSLTSANDAPKTLLSTSTGANSLSFISAFVSSPGFGWKHLHIKTEKAFDMIGVSVTNWPPHDPSWKKERKLTKVEITGNNIRIGNLALAAPSQWVELEFKHLAMNNARNVRIYNLDLEHGYYDLGGKHASVLCSIN